MKLHQLQSGAGGTCKDSGGPPGKKTRATSGTQFLSDAHPTTVRDGRQVVKMTVLSFLATRGVSSCQNAKINGLVASSNEDTHC